MDSLGMVERPHGFRSSFRTWAADKEIASYEVSETAMAHLVGTTVARAYQRSSLLDKRRHLMNEWAAYLTGRKGQVLKISSTIAQ